jgi:hypothetical protein
VNKQNGTGIVLCWIGLGMIQTYVYAECDRFITKFSNIADMCGGSMGLVYKRLPTSCQLTADSHFA